MSLENYYREKSEERLDEIMSMKHRLLSLKGAFAKLESVVNSGKIQTDEYTMMILTELTKSYETSNVRAAEQQNELTETKVVLGPRYKLLVQLMNQDLSISEIANHMGLTRSAIYLIRQQYKEQLKVDVDRGMRAMQFRKR